MKLIGVYIAMFVWQALGEEVLSPEVQTAEGSVQGTIKVTSEGNQFYAFQGIPFAKPPVGPLRFKCPEPAEPWSGVLQVTSDPPACMQTTFNVLNPAEGVEDCLQLNVYTPKLPSNQSNPLLPVHVFIHGGAFIRGEIDYDYYNPDRYMNADMVMIAIKYRLGVLGFLSTDDEAATGNAGLYDQNLALKWVQRNSAAFGGNPNDVTISGQSAGGASVLYHYLSPMSAGLFHRAISESGSPLNPWTLQENPITYSKQMAEHFNCTTDNTTKLIDCLQQQKAEDLVGHSFTMMIEDLIFCYVPSVETSSSGQFLTEDPLKMFEDGNFNQVPLQLGFNRDEGILVYYGTGSWGVFIFFRNVTDATFDYFIPSFLYAITDYRSNLVNVSYAIKDHYYAGVDYSNQTEVNTVTINWLSDVYMKSGIAQTAALVSSHDVTTYLYAYNYVSNTSDSNFTGGPDVQHGDELQYLFYNNITNDKDAEFGNRFFNLWLEFIINGNHEKPVGSDDQWLKTPPGQYNYYDINEQFIMRGNYDTVDMDFWWTTVPNIVNA